MTATYTLKVYDNKTKAPIAGLWVQAMDGSNKAITVGGSLLGGLTDQNGQAVISTDAPVCYLQASGPGYKPGSAQVTANSVNSVSLTTGAYTLVSPGSEVNKPLGAAGALNPSSQPVPPAQDQAQVQASVIYPVRSFIMAHMLLFGVVIVLLVVLIFKPSEE